MYAFVSRIVVGLGLQAEAMAVTVEFPEPGAMVADVVTLGVLVQGNEWELAAVTLSGPGVQSTAMTPSENGTFWATPDLSGAPFGAIVLVIDALDVKGTEATSSIALVHDRPPTVTLVQPGPGAVAHPDLHVVATCSDDAPGDCTSLVAELWNGSLTVSQPATTTLSATLSPGNTSNVWLTIRAHDSAGQEVILERPVPVETNPQLTVVAEIPGLVQDVAFGRALFTGSSATCAPGQPECPLWLHDLANGDQVPAPTGAVAGWLVPDGAVFLTSAGLVRWPSGDVAPIVGGASRTALTWPWLAWLAPRDHGFGKVRRLNLVTGATDAAPDSESAYGDAGITVAADGTVYYGGNGIRSWDGETAAAVASMADLPAAGDGFVVFRKKAPEGIGRHDSSGETLLSTAFPDPTSVRPAFLAAGGWMAYVKDGPTGTRQVWRRGVGTADEQLTFGADDTELVRLTEHGLLVAARAGSLGLLVEGTFAPIASASAAAFRMHDMWYVARAGTVFRLESPPVEPPVETDPGPELAEAPSDIVESAEDALALQDASGSPGDGPDASQTVTEAPPPPGSENSAADTSESAPPGSPDASPPAAGGCAVGTSSVGGGGPFAAGLPRLHGSGRGLPLLLALGLGWTRRQRSR